MCWLTIIMADVDCANICVHLHRMSLIAGIINRQQKNNHTKNIMILCCSIFQHYNSVWFVWATLADVRSCSWCAWWLSHGTLVIFVRLQIFVHIIWFEFAPHVHVCVCVQAHDRRLHMIWWCQFRVVKFNHNCLCVCVHCTHIRRVILCWGIYLLGTENSYRHEILKYIFLFTTKCGLCVSARNWFWGFIWNKKAPAHKNQILNWLQKHYI